MTRFALNFSAATLILIMCGCSTGRNAEFRAKSGVQLKNVYDQAIVHAESNELFVVSEFISSNYPNQKSEHDREIRFEDIPSIGTITVTFFEATFPSREISDPNENYGPNGQEYRAIAHSEKLEFGDGDFRFYVLLSSGDVVLVNPDGKNIDAWYEACNSMYSYPSVE